MEPDFSHDDPAADPHAGLGLARLAFTLAAVALGFQTADLVLHAYMPLFGDETLFAILNRREYAWYVGTPIAWGAALASYLLLPVARPGRARWAALALAGMNTFDVTLWLADHAAELSLDLPLAGLRDPWFAQAVRVFQWFELLIFAELAAATLRRLDQDDPVHALHGARATASLGLIVWALGFALRTAWAFRWFRRFDMRVVAEIQLLSLFGMILLAATAFQATLLCITAARHCAKARKAARRWQDDDTLLRPKDDFA